MTPSTRELSFTRLSKTTDRHAAAVSKLSFQKQAKSADRAVHLKTAQSLGWFSDLLAVLGLTDCRRPIHVGGARGSGSECWTSRTSLR
jgi:hypothetical protein